MSSNVAKERQPEKRGKNQERRPSDQPQQKSFGWIERQPERPAAITIVCFGIAHTPSSAHLVQDSQPEAHEPVPPR